MKESLKKDTILTRPARQLLEGKSRKIILLAFDIVCFVIITFLYYIIAGEVSCSLPVRDATIYIYNSLLLLINIFVYRFILRVYTNVWRYTNTGAYFCIVVADTIGVLVTFIIARIINSAEYRLYVGVCYYITVTALMSLTTLMSRFSYRLLYKRSNRATYQVFKKTNVAIAGAGQLGAYLASELLNSPVSNYQPMCFVDVNKTKIGGRVAGLPVYDPANVKQAIKKYAITEVIVAISNISSEKMTEMYDTYSNIGCKVKIYDLPVNDNVEFDKDAQKQKRVVRDFAIEDLLFRKPLTINDQSVLDYYNGKTILVTGGGGSIGSEICRQIAQCNPKKLIIFDIYENNAYDIQLELKWKYNNSLDLVVEIGSVRDKERLEGLFKIYSPEVVFHAAAHKHVPLMEHNGAEAIKNNVLGTYNTANMAEKYGVEKFILISTDKAVNPTNIMGASKRLCEMVVQCRIDSNTNFAAVRFGNVLGSNGSVIPLFKRQIETGRSITITDKRIIRYFMTIPEASSLVVQAGAMAKKGELFVLDMGKPVKIYDLAVRMIELAGYEPDKDIKIEEIGLRPGEKLYEELLIKTENLDKTNNDMIFIERDTPLTREEMDEKLDILNKAMAESKYEIGSPLIKDAIKRTVPTFTEPHTVNMKAAESEEMKISNEAITA